jgi:hypothetical protein
MHKRKVIVEVVINDDRVSNIEDLERELLLHQCYLLDCSVRFLVPQIVIGPQIFPFFRLCINLPLVTFQL